MIKYTLMCEHEHEFEIWFDRGSDYEKQAEKGQVICPYCQSTQTQKAPMAPNIHTTKGVDREKIAAKIRANIEASCDDVGEKFSEEARAMYYGDKPERGIYGQASPAKAKELVEEGIDIVPLPPALVPKSKHKFN